MSRLRIRPSFLEQYQFLLVVMINNASFTLKSALFQRKKLYGHTTFSQPASAYL